MFLVPVSARIVLQQGHREAEGFERGRVCEGYVRIMSLPFGGRGENFGVTNL